MMRKLSLYRLASRTVAPLAFTLTVPVLANAQSWLIGVSPLADVPPGTATQAIAQMYSEQSSQQTSSGLGPVSLTPSYVRQVLPGTSVFYNADTGSHGTINYLSGGRALVTETESGWPRGDSVVPKSSLTIIQTTPNGNLTWTKILD